MGWIVDPPQYPSDLFYGSKPLNLRFKTGKGRRRYFCLNNRTLHLAEDDFDAGTYTTGSLLHTFCSEHCEPTRRTAYTPCPAFVTSHRIGQEDSKGLADVEPHKNGVHWEECAGVRALLEMTETEEERFFLLSYLEYKAYDEGDWRSNLIEEWNECWHRVPEGFGSMSRRSKFDRVMWSSMRFPALIPQVWLNWLSAASDADQRLLDENPSRVDFIGFWQGERHIIEIDGPSHYAAFDEVSRTYSVDEYAYARNLKIARSLGRDDWTLTRIARVEIRDVAEGEFPEFDAYKFLDVLPFQSQDYQGTWRIANVGWVGVRASEPVFSDDIPF